MVNTFNICAAMAALMSIYHDIQKTVALDGATPSRKLPFHGLQGRGIVGIFGRNPKSKPN
jgi:hypothetical protein